MANISDNANHATASHSSPKKGNTKNAKPAVNPAEILLPALILTAICATATLLLALTNMLTQGKIAANADEKAAESRMLVLEAADYVQLDEEGKVYGALDFNRHQTGVVVVTETKGYGGTIQVMTGVRTSGEVSGVTILSMSETPGLGAKTKEEAFLAQYLGTNDPDLAVNKDGGNIQAVSGATISSRAVTDAVNAAIAIAVAYLDASDAQ